MMDVEKSTSFFPASEVNTYEIFLCVWFQSFTLPWIMRNETPLFFWIFEAGQAAVQAGFIFPV